MTIGKNALVLVTDGERMLLLRNHGAGQNIDLKEMAQDDADRDSRDTAADGSGRGAGGDHETPRQAEEDRFVREVADKVSKMAVAGKYDELVIVAPPKALGELRKHLHKEAERRVVKTFDKEMTSRPIADIAALINGA